MPGDEVRVNVRVPKSLRDVIDEISREWGISNRSVVVRMALTSFVEEHAAARFQCAKSHEEEEGTDLSVERKPFVFRRQKRAPQRIRRKARRKAHEEGDRTSERT